MPTRQPGMKPFLATVALRWFASAQAMPLVVIHGAWMLLAVATWSHAHPGPGQFAETGAALMRGYAWLGGMGEDGRHGNEDTLMAVWLKLSLPLYLVLELARWYWGPRPTLRWWWLVAASAAIALGGTLLALWPSLVTPKASADAPWVIGMFALFAALATTWALLVRRGTERLITRYLTTRRIAR